MPIHDWKRVIAGIFHDFHHEWISEIKRSLNHGLLPPDYYALAEQWAGDFGPDVLTLGRPSNGKTSRHGPKRPRPKGAIALAETPPKVAYWGQTEMEYYTKKANAIAIRHASDHELVAIVEIVSPGNKNGAKRLKKFVEKAHSLMQEGVNLLILDLIPPNNLNPEGIHPVIWEEISGESERKEEFFHPPSDKPLTLASYIAGGFPRAFVEPTAVGLKLADMPLFLTDDEYVSVPLDATYQAAWNEVPAIWQEVLEKPKKAVGSKKK